MNWITFIGFVAATLTTLSFLPQAIRVIRTKNTNAISLSMYIIFAIGVAFWLIYGIALNEPPIIAANIITLILSSIILYFKIKHG